MPVAINGLRPGFFLSYIIYYLLKHAALSAMTTTPTSMSRANRNSLTQFVERQLRESILMAKFAPGEQLNIRELAETLGTSTTPIREALMRLSAQRILEA